jgi:clan AA aspartic protease
MGMTVVKMRVSKDKAAKRFVEDDFLVDSGAAYTVIPRKSLRRLGVKPDEKLDFFLADGTKITRDVGEAYLTLGEKSGTSKVIFGEEGDSNLLGVLTLETFGLVLDPFKRKLMPMRLALM